MKLMNTYSNRLEEFKPIKPGEISIYICGPTVYNYIHIGNARPVVFFDTVRRYFEAKGYKVRFASNFTDVDDKIIQKAIESGKSELQISQFYINAFLQDLQSLGCQTDYIQPKVTEYMDEIIRYIQELVAKGFAYEIHGDVYFRVSKVNEYGALSNRKLEDLITGARVEMNPDKENPLDFTLWKKTTEGIHWDSPFSKGRPGWHTECVAMIDQIFGEEIDIHGGGSDLIFPHHENEIAQSVACHHHPVARYWLHNGRLNFEGEKMSKSLGNVVFVKDLPGDKMAFRLLLLSTYYRAPINYTSKSLRMYEQEWDKLENTVESLYRSIELSQSRSSASAQTDSEITQLLAEFDQAMEMDFNTPNAITALQSLMKLANVKMREEADIPLLKAILDGLLSMLDILGLRVYLPEYTDQDRMLLTQWEALRKAKEFAKADELRNELKKRKLL